MDPVGDPTFGFDAILWLETNQARQDTQIK